MNKNKRKLTKNLAKKPKQDKITRMFDLTKKHGILRIKNKDKNLIMLTEEKYSSLVQQKEELEESLKASISSIDIRTLKSSVKDPNAPDTQAEDLLQKYKKD